ILDERIAAQPLISVRWDHKVTGLAQDAAGVTLACATSGGPVALRADYVVACTGARGDEVRAMLGASFDGQSFGDLFLICDIRTDLPGWARERRFFFHPPRDPRPPGPLPPRPGPTHPFGRPGPPPARPPGPAAAPP